MTDVSEGFSSANPFLNTPAPSAPVQERSPGGFSSDTSGVSSSGLSQASQLASAWNVSHGFNSTTGQFSSGSSDHSGGGGYNAPPVQQAAAPKPQAPPSNNDVGNTPSPTNTDNKPTGGFNVSPYNVGNPNPVIPPNSYLVSNPMEGVAYRQNLRGGGYVDFNPTTGDVVGNLDVRHNNNETTFTPNTLVGLNGNYTPSEMKFLNDTSGMTAGDLFNSGYNIFPINGGVQFTQGQKPSSPPISNNDVFNTLFGGMASFNGQAQNMIAPNGYLVQNQTTPRVYNPSESMSSGNFNNILIDPSGTAQQSIFQDTQNQLFQANIIESKGTNASGSDIGKYFAIEGGLFVAGVGEGALFMINPLAQGQATAALINDPVTSFENAKMAYNTNPAGFLGNLMGSMAIGGVEGYALNEATPALNDINPMTRESVLKSSVESARFFSDRAEIERMKINTFLVDNGINKDTIAVSDLNTISVLSAEKSYSYDLYAKGEGLVSVDNEIVTNGYTATRLSKPIFIEFGYPSRPVETITILDTDLLNPVSTIVRPKPSVMNLEEVPIGTFDVVKPNGEVLAGSNVFSIKSDILFSDMNLPVRPSDMSLPVKYFTPKMSSEVVNPSYGSSAMHTLYTYFKPDLTDLALNNPIEFYKLTDSNPNALANLGENVLELTPVEANIPYPQKDLFDYGAVELRQGRTMSRTSTPLIYGSPLDGWSPSFAEDSLSDYFNREVTREQVRKDLGYEGMSIKPKALEVINEGSQGYTISSSYANTGTISDASFDVEAGVYGSFSRSATSGSYLLSAKSILRPASSEVPISIQEPQSITSFRSVLLPIQEPQSITSFRSVLLPNLSTANASKNTLVLDNSLSNASLLLHRSRLELVNKSALASKNTLVLDNSLSNASLLLQRSRSELVNKSALSTVSVQLQNQSPILKQAQKQSQSQAQILDLSPLSRLSFSPAQDRINRPNNKYSINDYFTQPVDSKMFGMLSGSKSNIRRKRHNDLFSLPKGKRGKEGLSYLPDLLDISKTELASGKPFYSMPRETKSLKNDVFNIFKGNFNFGLIPTGEQQRARRRGRK